MGEVSDWSTTAAGNAIVAGLDWREGMDFSRVNDNAREMMAQIRRAIKAAPTVNVLDYGAVADGTFDAGTGTYGGTDNLTAFNAAATAAAASRASIYVPGGDYYLSGRFVLPEGVTIYGDGTAGSAKWIGGTRNGTVLMIQGASGQACFKWTENSHHGLVADLSIFQANNVATSAVIECVGVLHPRMMRVEYGALRKVNTIGLLLAPSAAGALYETLYGEFDNLICTHPNAGLASEGAVARALVIRSTGLFKRSNANHFRGGVFAGYLSSLDIVSTVAGAGSYNVTFSDCVFESSYDPARTHTYVNDAKILGIEAAAYGVRFVNITHANAASFTGCYFEMGGLPSTYNDGTNGVASLFPVVWLDTATEVFETRFDGSAWLNAYLRDGGARTSCTTDVNGYRYDNTRPIMLLARAAAAQAIPTATYTALDTPTIVAGATSYIGWDAANKRAVIRSAGAYMVTARCGFAGWSTVNTYVTSRLVAGGLTLQGSMMGQAGTSVPLETTASGTFLLSAGDTITFQAFQNEGGSQNTDATAANNFLSIVKVA
jgi:hypothetical protein